MSKFKVGDKVRRINTDHGFLRVGDIGEVVEVGHRIKLKDDSTFRHDPDNLELVQTSESELERLVRVANEGARATVELYEKYRDFVEANQLLYTGQSIKGRGFHVEIYDFKVKPKPAFEPFTVGSGWQVKLEGETLHIGCKKFNASKFGEFLQGYIKGVELTVCNYPSQEITHTLGTRSGIQFTFRSEKHVLRWEDADRILAALEKAGIK